jgi:hypothetical protein
VPLSVVALTVHAGQALAQGAFPAPLPGQGVIKNDPAFPPVNGATRSDPAFPPVNGAAPTPSLGAPPSNSFPVSGAAPISGSAFERPAPPQGGPPEDCMKQFVPLREEAEKRGKLIQAASDRHATPDVACKLIRSFGESEIKMIKYVESHATKCGIPAQVSDQLKNGHKNTEGMVAKVCHVAEQMAQQQKGPSGPSLSDVLGSSAALPEATATKKGGSTFDTMNGNVLTR